MFDKKPPHPEPRPTLATIFVAIYVRISKDAQARGLGVRDQEQDCRKLAERLGWIVYRVFVDNDIRVITMREIVERGIDACTAEIFEIAWRGTDAV